MINKIQAPQNLGVTKIRRKIIKITVSGRCIYKVKYVKVNTRCVGSICDTPDLPVPKGYLKKIKTSIKFINNGTRKQRNSKL